MRLPLPRYALLLGALLLASPAAMTTAQTTKAPTMPQAVTRITPQGLFDSATHAGYSQISVSEAGRLAFVSGQVAWQADGSPVPADLAGQTEVVLANLATALDALGAAPADILQLKLYVLDASEAAQGVVMPRLMAFLDGARPSLTGLGVAALAAPDLQIEIEMVVRVPD